jgi:uncharacterized coiled-coil DUF342 family protein
MQLKMKLWDYKEPIKQLSEAKAVEIGSTLLSEVIIFSVAALAIIGEAWRSNRKSTNSRKEIKTGMGDLESELQKLKDQGDQHHMELERLHLKYCELEAEFKALHSEVAFINALKHHVHIEDPFQQSQ